jgi:hypothetical protein
MRRYFVSSPSFSSCYASDQRFVIELRNDEQIAGVHRGHRPVVVIAPRESYHYTCGDMPRFLPAEFGGRLLSVFEWKHTGVCQYAEGEAEGEAGVLWSQDWRGNGPLVCRTRRTLTLSDAQPFDSAWEWSEAPVEDLDPELTAREDALRVAFPQFAE